MSQDVFNKALAIGRPPNVVQNFPNSKALIVSGKVIDRAMIDKGHAMTIAANGRNIFIIEGALKAAQRANAAIIIEIARSEATYCPTTLWNLARRVDYLMKQVRHHRARGRARGPLLHEEMGRRARGQGGDPVPLRRGHHLHRPGRLAHDRRPEPAGEHRGLPLHPVLGGL